MPVLQTRCIALKKGKQEKSCKPVTRYIKLGNFCRFNA